MRNTTFIDPNSGFRGIVSSGWHDGARSNWHAEVCDYETGESIAYTVSASSEYQARRRAIARAKAVGMVPASMRD